MPIWKPYTFGRFAKVAIQWIRRIAAMAARRPGLDFELRSFANEYKVGPYQLWVGYNTQE